jgi:hypothetical protein
LSTPQRKCQHRAQHHQQQHRAAVLLAAVMAPVPYQSSGKAVQKLMLGLHALWKLLMMQPGVA